MRELQSTTAPTGAEARRWIGRRVDDIHGKPIGRLADVLDDPATGRARWLLVRYGPGAESCTLVPLREASQTDRRVWVDLDREFVRSGPWIHPNSPISARTSDEFARHYGLRSARAAAWAQSLEPVPASSRPPAVPMTRSDRRGPAAVSASAFYGRSVAS
jgi:hypothetical protein